MQFQQEIREKTDRVRNLEADQVGRVQAPSSTGFVLRTSSFADEAYDGYGGAAEEVSNGPFAVQRTKRPRSTIRKRMRTLTSRAFYRSLGRVAIPVSLPVSGGR